MINKPKKIKITNRRINFWFYLLMTVLCIVLLIYISLFLYFNFYQTITQSKEIIILKDKVAIETVDIVKFNIIIEKLAKKTTIKTIANLNNPFD